MEPEEGKKVNPPRYVKDKQRRPMNGWSAVQPETGRRFTTQTLPQLAKEVYAYRLANDLKIEPNFDRQLEDQICRSMPQDEAAGRCRYLDTDDTKNPDHLRNWRSTREHLTNFAIAADKVLAGHAAGQTIHVSQEEADRRAQICGQCRLNMDVANCWGCGKLGSMYRKLAGNLTTPTDHLLKTCDACGCDNRTQVHFTGEILKAIAKDQAPVVQPFPDWCWKKQALESQP